MKTQKIMSIIGLVIAGLSFICLSMFNTPREYEAAIGWGVIATLYLIALSIVALIKSKKIN